MSSTYSPICLSHDPGIVLGPEFTYDEANALNSRRRFEGHEHCDIVIGRFSYPLIEAACLGSQLPGPTGCKGHHGGPQWIDRDWLRLLFAATTPPNAVHPEVLRPLVSRCWPLERLGRLRNELGLPEPSASATASGDTYAAVTASPENASGPCTCRPASCAVNGNLSAGGGGR